MKYHLVACGGTFDLLHAGHKAFLKFAFSVGEQVVIGLTTDEYIKKCKPGNNIASYAKRKTNLVLFLKSEKLLDKAKIVPIDSVFGITLEKDIPLDGLVVSKETNKGAIDINREREKLNLSPLPIIVTDMVKPDIPLSSSTIRGGKIDTEGHFFIDPVWQEKDLYLPEKLRGMLHKPFGDLLTSKQIKDIALTNPATLVTVGDVTTKTIHEMGISQKISVVDFVVEREKKFSSLSQLGFLGDEVVYTLTNPAGIITASVWQICQDIILNLSLKKQFVLKVSGEEDLLVLPLILSLPLGFSIFYGQPHKGIVRVITTLSTKQKAKEIINEFEAKNTTRGY